MQQRLDAVAARENARQRPEGKAERRLVDDPRLSFCPSFHIYAEEELGKQRSASHEKGDKEGFSELP